MAGVFLLAMGLARLGAIIKFIPRAGDCWFYHRHRGDHLGRAVEGFFGLQVSFTGINHFHDKLLLLIDALPHAHWATTGLALLGLLITLNINRILPGNLKRIPGPLLAMIAGDADPVLRAFRWRGDHRQVRRHSAGAAAIPAARLTFTRVVELLGPALTIALLGAIESLLSAVVADGMTGEPPRFKPGLIGQGVGNIGRAVFGGFAATGALRAPPPMCATAATARWRVSSMPAC